MKSVLSKVFTCSALMLATLTANATADHGVLAGVIAYACMPTQHDIAAYSFALDASKKVHASITLDKVASSDEDQADSSDADTMLT